MTSRRSFIRQTAVLGAAATIAGHTVFAAAANTAGTAKKLPPLSFSTLGCPDWAFPAILDFAVKNNYQGIEVRGILRQMDLTLVPEFSTSTRIADTVKQMKDHDLRFVDLGSSTELHHKDPATRDKNLDEARRFIDLAHDLQCPFVRVFPNRLPKEENRETTIDLIVQGLLTLGDHARGSHVTVLLESHGDLTDSSLVESIMKKAEHKNVGLVWDIYNMWTVAKEPPAQVYAKLKKYIRHTHIKDGITVDGKEEYKLLGKGESPIFEAVDLLRAGGYKGFYSFEWEKLWHPEIDAPEIALADYPVAMAKHFNP